MERCGFEVKLEQYDTMQNRVAHSGSWSADLHVPIHTNAFNAFIVEANYSEISDQKSNTLKSVEEIAKEVISGKWGNGQERVDRLTEAGYNASEVQVIVNKMICMG